MERKHRKFARRCLASLLAVLLATLPLSYPLTAQAEGPTGSVTIPTDTQPANPRPALEPWKIVANFVTGESDTLLENGRVYPVAEAPSVIAMAQSLNEENIDYYGLELGTVSDKPINGTCYATKDGKWFKLASRATNIPPDAVKLTGNDACQNALSKSRTITLQLALIKNKVAPNRLIPLDFPALTMRPGGNLPNQSVVIWLVTAKDIGDPDLTGKVSINGKNLNYYLFWNVDLTMCPTCVVRTSIKQEGDTYVIYVQVINNAYAYAPEASRAPDRSEEDTVTVAPPPPKPKNESFCKEHKAGCIIGVSAGLLVLGILGYGATCIEAEGANGGGDARTGGCWFK